MVSDLGNQDTSKAFREARHFQGFRQIAHSLGLKGCGLGDSGFGLREYMGGCQNHGPFLGP